MLFLDFSPVAGNAGISVDINIPMPGIVITEPPAMVVVAGTYVYFAPDIEADLFFYRGYWYRPYQGRWYISLEYNGHWGGIAIGHVPPALINLPPDYRSTYPDHERMSCAMVQRNWRTWEEERYWDNYEGRDEHAMPRHGHGMGHGMGMGM